MRLWGITEYPPGLYPDQAANGEDALEILSGKLQVYSLRNNGRESLFLYVQALTVGLFGVGVWQLFLASALVGVATVGATYLAGARLFGRGAALLAALFLATNPWHVTLSRTGFRAVTVPLFIVLTLWGLARVFQSTTGRGRMISALYTGVAIGLGAYTYTAGRAFAIFLVLAMAIGAVRLVCSRGFRERYRNALLPLAVSGVIACAVALPLLRVFAAHPELAFVRAQHVSVFNPDLNGGEPWATLLRMAGRTLGAFAWDGDGNPRHNVPHSDLPYTPGGHHAYNGGGAPFLSLVPAVLAIVGMGVALRRAPWLILLFVVMLLPAITTAEGMPHGLRTVGAIPTHVFFAGLGGAWLWRLRRTLNWGSIRFALPALAAVALVLTAVSDLVLYFGIARNSALAHYEYRADLTDVNDYLQVLAAGNRHMADESRVPYLVLDEFSEQTVHFLTTPTGHPYRLVDPKESSAAQLQSGEYIVFAQSTLFDAERYRRLHPGVRVLHEHVNRFGEITVRVFGR